MLDGTPWRESLVLAAIAIAMLGDFSYFLSVLRRRTKPHIFTWFIWGLVGSIAVAAQFVAGGGVGAWPTLYSSLFCFLIIGLSLHFGEKHITRSDWFCFVSALAAVILWIITREPLWSVIIVTLIDAFAYYPTFRKSWNKPYEEALASYVTADVKLLMGIVALERINLITVLYPVAVVIMNALFVVTVMWRRQKLSTMVPAA